MAKDRLYLGLDAGSVSLNTVIIKNGEVVAEDYTRIREQTVKTALEVLERLFSEFDYGDVVCVGATGSGGKILAELLNGEFTNEIVALTKSVEKFHPEARTIIDIGGEDAKIIFPKYDPELDSLVVEDFSMNTMCAAGTGSFLDQQAHRLGVAIEGEFGELALKSKTPPRIAGRCSVFAKTDMIHLQQEGTPDYDIIAGLCFALARTFKSNICKGRDPVPPAVFQGGVASNSGMVKAVRETFGLDESTLIIPKHHTSMGAIGAAILCGGRKPAGLSKLREYIKDFNPERKGLKPLSCPGSCADEPDTRTATPSADEIIPGTRGYIGIDVGSLSTNVIVIDDDRNLIARKYLPTAGRPIEAVRRGIKEIGEEIGHLLDIRGVGTTGSGRYLIGDFVGADTVKNEITAQATASIFIDPTVDTIFEIGGQDSKYISVEDGVVVDFEMNKVCAAGTGSFLEEQAERLSLSIKEEFGKRALSSETPVPLGERCTVFMESDIVSHQQQLARTEDLVAGLSYSIVKNYLNRVVGKRKIGDNIFFQGAVALNKGVVAAFRKVTGKNITVPPNNDVTGAIGVAILAREASEGSEKSNFKGWEQVANAKYELRSFECRDCPNHCEIREIITEGSNPSYYGSRCEKYNTDESKKSDLGDIPDLFLEREKFLTADYDRIPEDKKTRGVVGIPMALYTYEMLPFWKSFLENLGYKVVFSDRTNKAIINRGIDIVAAETCFPVKVAHGHIANLLKKKIDYLFLPMVVNMKHKNPGTDQSAACPYVQAMPHMAKAAFDFTGIEAKVLTPTVAFGWGDHMANKGLIETARLLGRGRAEALKAARAAEAAQEKFRKSLKKRGAEILSSLPEGRIPVVIVSRPYNGCDNGVNLNLPRKLRSLGALPIPMDYLASGEVDLSEEWPSMYWGYGQKILGAADIIRRDDRLQCLYITNFGCGPDSFITQFFREKMTGKPHLEIEVDEHSADVGAITRCEAFLDSIKSAKAKDIPETKRKHAFISPASQKKRKLYIPYMGDIAYILAAALKAEDIDAEVFPPSNEETLEIGRQHTCGRECYPCIITTGDMLRVARQEGFDPEGSAFFMPTAMGPCRFGQYNRLQRIILNDQGFENVPIISPNQIRNLDGEMKDFGKNIFRKTWKGLVGADVLAKMVRETRPYETNAGETDRAYDESLTMLCGALARRESVEAAMKTSVERFKQIPVSNPGSRPLVGVIGEIFVRSHEFANNNIVREIESLGGEVWLTPVTEWFFHINNTLKLYTKITRKYPAHILSLFAGFVQRKDEHAIAKIAEEYLRNPHEPSIDKIWANSEPYLPGWFGETALGIGKSVDYIEKGASGIINVMPFTCLPGNISAAIFKRFRTDYDNIPLLNMAYDGTEETNTRTRLEAYMYQVKQYRDSRAAKES